MSGDRPELRRTLSVWQAVGLSVALMAPSMAANINPQQTAAAAGRAVPLAFLLSAAGVLLVAYGFVQLCRHYQHAGSVYAFVGATLGPRAGVVSGIGLLGTYTFCAVVTSSAAGVLGTAFLTQVGIWPHPPSWGPFVLTAVALIGSWLLAVAPARRGTSTLLAVEGATIALILLVTVVILVRLVAGGAPSGRFTLQVFVPDTGVSGIFLGAVFGFLSFAGFEAAATLGEETRDPRRNIPRAILGTAIFGGAYFVLVTAVEMTAFGGDATAFHNSPSLLGDLGGRFVGPWAGDVISAGAAISAFGCCLACVVGGSRLLFALGRDAFDGRGIGRVSAKGTPAVAVTAVALAAALIILVCAVFFGATADDTFAWAGSIGTLILLVIYLVTTLGAILLLFVRRRMRVPWWHLAFPLAALVLLGYTVYVNVVPYPTEGPASWFPVVAGGVLVLAVVVVVSARGFARRVGERLAEGEA
ncbi:APC family permease [Amycolatopsis echigonensis]|uniref:APC family permease n=1 Tax=Amycolatopsis echigonensis TaxID=2576905 RepID=A0A2N3WA57_9PSEU|nr:MULTISPECIES: APC family permease [Amycolatopsis]MBB2505660.1 APC family permease [Amycolatopsis echigonensis]PKV90754.1 amino acid/polyamine/organocation transporter (APC superfamily) [Amycolatopsis niigatensis]